MAGLGLLLHQLSGGREDDAQPMYLAGLLHDVGKLGVPLELIEKEGGLTQSEFARVSEHAELSYKALSGLPTFQRVAVWAAFHHERLDGSGYPRGLTGRELPLESRIVAVSDVLAALTEQRPYRRALPAREALKVLESMARSRALDSDLVSIVNHNLPFFNSLRHDINEGNQAFLHSLANDAQIAFRSRGSSARRPTLGYAAPLSA